MWLQDRPEDALRELQSAVELSPNLALGHYTIAFVHAQTGDAGIAVAEADQARALSATARPNAHVHIQAIAQLCLALAGKTAAAKEMAIAIRRAQPNYGVGDLLKAFKVGPELQALTHKAARIVEG